MTKLTHFDDQGRAHMVNVGEKATTLRRASAEGWITMQAKTLGMIVAGQHKKGDVLGVARTAAIMAAKRTADLIPLCHPIGLTHVGVDFEPHEPGGGVRCVVHAQTHAQTGVEMEALTAVQIALLTIYDMCKAVDREMVMSDIRLLEKSGGRSGHWRRDVV